MKLQFTNALFVSDTHLTKDRPECIRAFFEFLNWVPDNVDALFILGDFFEYWVGDDIESTLSDDIATHINSLSTAKNIKIFFITGNRDFALGEIFAKKCNMTILADETIIRVAGKQIFISHGDLLCTDDKSYQRFRKIIRNPFILKSLLALPIKFRISIAEKLRQNSMRRFKAHQTYVDVNPSAVEECFHQKNVDYLIHGHTHIPDIHSTHNGKRGQLRMVLGDWHLNGWIGSFNENGPALYKFDIADPDFSQFDTHN